MGGGESGAVKREKGEGRRGGGVCVFGTVWHRSARSAEERVGGGWRGAWCVWWNGSGGAV